MMRKEFLLKKMAESIIIDFERAGGYAGLTLHATIDSHSLSAEEAEQLVRLMHEAGISDLVQGSTLTHSSPDQFTYRLTIKWGEDEHSVQLAEKQIPTSMRPLLKFLTIRSRYKKENKKNP
jgi:hypothetical protein